MEPLVHRDVLIVEDDADLAEIMGMTLESVGYRARIARDGHEALDKVDEQMPALILLDMRMPNMNGWEFARAFRNLHGRQVPIVVVTAAESAAARAAEVNAQGVLGKPFELDALVRMVARFLR